jgi:large subunit ribosomal protein L9e
VTGPRGTLTKSFNHLNIDIKVVGKTVRAEIWFGTKALKACCRTVISHIKNMMTGVTKGFLYKMKLVYNHFPITVVHEKNTIEIKNFLGEKKDRVITLPKGVSMDRPKDVKDELVFTGNDIDAVSQICADIHTATLVRDKDIRKFLDGIYVSYRGNVIDE